MREAAAERPELPVSRDRRRSTKSLTACLSLVFLLLGFEARPSFALLKKYTVRHTVLQQIPTPATLVPIPGNGLALIDDGAAPGAPVLSRLRVVTDWTTTSCCPVGGFIFASQNTSESPADNQVGTGSLASSIAWGTVTGWTVTGSFFCHSAPSYLCNFVEAADLATVDPPQFSSFYDLGTWTFHGTGFSATPFVHSRLPPQ